MMRFLREFRGYIGNIHFLSAAQHEPLKFSYFFRLHLFVAFVVAFSFTPDIIDIVRSASHKLTQIPQGITVEKKGAVLQITGLVQPYTLSDGEFNMVVDTTGATKDRPTSSTVFVTKDALSIAPVDGRPEQRVLWQDGGDFTIKLDEARDLLTNHEGTAVTVMTLLVFLYLFVSSGIFSTLLVVLWGLLSSVLYRLVFRQKLAVRDAIALHMVAVTAPLVLWGICVITGLGSAPLVEVIVFVVYSVLGLRFGSYFKPPGEQSSSDKK